MMYMYTLDEYLTPFVTFTVQVKEGFRIRLKCHDNILNRVALNRINQQNVIHQKDNHKEREVSSLHYSFYVIPITENE